MINIWIPQHLIEKHRNGDTFTPEEQEEFDNWKNEDERHGAYLDDITRPGRLEELKAVALATDIASMSRKIEEALDRRERVVKMWTRRVAIAAAVLTAIVLGYFSYKSRVRSASPEQETAWRPSTEKRSIVLPGGKEIYLDTASGGWLANKDRWSVTKTNQVSLAFAWMSGTRRDTDKGDFVVSNPRGSYRMAMPDGSRIWLNDSSAIRFPAGYGLKERRVQVSGCAYFEVADDAAHPFRLNYDTTEISVLGTRFEVRAYPDEGRIYIKVRDGVVGVDIAGKRLTLRRGQCVRFDAGKPGGERFYFYKIIEDNVGGWCRDLLDFTNQDPKGIAAILTKHYGMEAPRFVNGAEFMGPLGKGSLNGRNPLDSVLKQLSVQELEFKVVGKSIHVIKN